MPAPGSTVGAASGRVGGLVVGDPEIWLGDVTHDSALAGPDVLFVAVKGSTYDGHDYVGSAVRAGSPAVVVETLQDSPATQIVVGDTRTAMGPIAALVHGDPSTLLAVVGVTGTNGKTTVTHYLESLLTSAGRVVGLIGTIETRVGAMSLPSVRTTPEATDFQRLLDEMRQLDAGVVAAEVSSHALEMGRVAGTRFEVAAFTNLSQDHLDFHGSMESYRRAKERLFREYEVGTAVLNVDDPVGAAIASWVKTQVIRVGRAGEVRGRRRRDVPSRDSLRPGDGSGGRPRHIRSDRLVQRGERPGSGGLLPGPRVDPRRDLRWTGESWRSARSIRACLRERAGPRHCRLRPYSRRSRGGHSRGKVDSGGEGDRCGRRRRRPGPGRSGR